MSRLCSQGHVVERDYVSPTYCPTCRREKYLANKEASNTQSRRWYQENKERHKAVMAEWYSTNPGRMRELTADWYQKNREKHLERSRQWAKDHPEAKRLARKRRRERDRNAPGHATDQQVWWRMEYYGMKCVYCGGPFEEVDHRIAISRGGCAWPANLVPSCMPCNRSKLAKSQLEFERE